MKLSELKLIAKEHNIKCSCLNKREIVDLLGAKGILVDQLVKEVKVKKETNPKYAFLKETRKSPKSVEIRDRETGEIIVYSSIYKATRALNSHSTSVITKNDGKVWKNRYEIKIQ
jgi:hypothetical protein